MGAGSEVTSKTKYAIVAVQASVAKVRMILAFMTPTLRGRTFRCDGAGPASWQWNPWRV